jgi:hypothetical protein
VATVVDDSWAFDACRLQGATTSQPRCGIVSEARQVATKGYDAPVATARYSQQ